MLKQTRDVSLELRGERACDVLPKRMLEGTHDVWKACKCNPADRGQCHRFALLAFLDAALASVCLAFVTDLACRDCVERNSPPAGGVPAASRHASRFVLIGRFSRLFLDQDADASLCLVICEWAGPLKAKIGIAPKNYF